MAEMFPSAGRIIGLDFGTVRIGIAISDSDRVLASPLETYTRQSQSQDATYFQQLVEREEVVGIVVGLPVHMSGDESSISQVTRTFAAWLQEVTRLPIVFQDERMTSALAEQALQMGSLTSKKRKKRRDMLAAQMILSAFLESGGGATNLPLND